MHTQELGVGALPIWLTVVSSLSITIAVGCALWTAFDITRRPQKMAVMNIVWPVTMLFGSVVWLVFYLRRGRSGSGESDRKSTPMSVSVAVGASHCGAGCALGDLVGEFTLVAAPGLATVFGLGWLFSERIFAGWVLDFLLAFLFGIGFQYFAIAPMRQLSIGKGLWQAVKADTLSIASWQIGMYGAMALIQFGILLPLLGGTVAVLTPEFWFAMQIAMVAGFATSYPVNWLLIRWGVKERM